MSSFPTKNYFTVWLTKVKEILRRELLWALLFKEYLIQLALKQEGLLVDLKTELMLTYIKMIVITLTLVLEKEQLILVQ